MDDEMHDHAARVDGRAKDAFLPLSFFFSSRRRHTRWPRDWSSDVCSSDLLGREFVLRQRNASRVAAGSTETRYETELLRIGAAEKYERDRFIKFLRNPSDVAADCQHHIGLEDYQFGCQNWKPVDPSFRITRFDRDISSLDVT